MRRRSRLTVPGHGEYGLGAKAAIPPVVEVCLIYAFIQGRWLPVCAWLVRTATVAATGQVWPREVHSEGLRSVTKYTIAIYPDDASDEEQRRRARQGPGVDLVVDLSAAGSAITAVTVYPGGSGEWPPGGLAEVDIREALALALRLVAARDVADARRAHTARGAVTPPPTPTDGRRGVRRAGGSGRRGRDAVANSVPTDVAKTYWRLGSAAKVAEHYDVPHQIARDWIRTLRKGGKVPNPWRQRGRT